jgi:hypothetical protein
MEGNTSRVLTTAYLEELFDILDLFWHCDTVNIRTLDSKEEVVLFVCEYPELSTKLLFGRDLNLEGSHV